MKYIIRLFALPILIVAYLFYFLWYGIFEILGSAWRRVEDSWELTIAWYLLIIPLFAIHIVWLPLVFALLTGYWEWMALSVLTGCIFPVPGGCAIAESEAEYDPMWTLLDIVNLIFPPNPEKQLEIIQPDKDYLRATKELDKEFPGVQA